MKSFYKGSSGAPAVHLPKDVYDAMNLKTNLKFWPQKKKRVRHPVTGLGGILSQIEKEIKVVEGGSGDDRETANVDEVQVEIARALKNKYDTTPPVLASQKVIPFQYELDREKKLKKMAKYAIERQQLFTSHLANQEAMSEKKTRDAYKTLFVGRLDKTITPEQLREVFESKFGDLLSLHLITTKTKKNYAFLEFANESDFNHAVKEADGMLINDTHIVVDVERGRTVSAWIPRRFGGGLGGPPRERNQVLKIGRGPPERVYNSGKKRALPSGGREAREARKESRR